MEAKFFGEFFKIPAGRIGNVGPYDITINLAKLTNVTRDAVSLKLGVAIQADSSDHLYLKLHRSVLNVVVLCMQLG